MTSEALKALAERVEGATGGDRYLDALIVQALTPELHDAFADRVGFVVGGNHEQPTRAPELTASIDAALGLVERVLPGWTVGGMRQGDNKLWTVELREGFATSYGRVVIAPSARGYNGAPLPIAILAALLRALLAKGE